MSLLIQGKSEMFKLWSKRTLQFVGTLAVVALAIIVCRRTDWSKGFSPDGNLTLVTAAIAFVAVIIQIRSSSKQVQDQIRAQRDAEEEDRERQMRSVAAALLSEIDCFYASHLEPVSRAFESWRMTENDPQSVEAFRFVAGKPFTVYESLADKLGGFDATIAWGIVYTYGTMGAFAELLKLYEREMSGMSSRDRADQEMRSENREVMRNKIRELAKTTTFVMVTMCRPLCHFCGKDFSTLFIAKDPEAGS